MMSLQIYIGNRRENVGLDQGLNLGPPTLQASALLAELSKPLHSFSFIFQFPMILSGKSHTNFFGPLLPVHHLRGLHWSPNCTRKEKCAGLDRNQTRNLLHYRRVLY